MRKFVLCIIAVLLAPISQACASDVGFSFGINYGYPGAVAPGYAPQPVVIEEPPQFVEPPGFGFYMAIGGPYDLFFVNNAYYLCLGNVWYTSPFYNGPWYTIYYDDIPYALRRYPYSRIHNYRDYYFRRYQDYGDWRGYHHFRPGRRDWRRPAFNSTGRPDRGDWNRPVYNAPNRPYHGNWNRHDYNSPNRRGYGNWRRPDYNNSGRSGHGNWNRPGNNAPARPYQGNWSRPANNSPNRPGNGTWSRPVNNNPGRSDHGSWNRPVDRPPSAPARGNGGRQVNVNPNGHDHGNRGGEHRER